MFWLCWLACTLDGPERETGPTAVTDTEERVETDASDSDTEVPVWTSGAYRMEHDDLQRVFVLTVPDALPVGAPLVVAMHGYGGSASGMQSYAGLDALAESEGFVVVYPEGTPDSWGYRYWEVGYAFHDGSVDDVGFIRALADQLVDELALGEVFATGFSNGGDMSYRLACEADDLVEAVAPVAGCLMVVLQESCSPASEPALLEIHGTDDPITPWEGDPEGDGGYGAYLGTEQSVGHFVEAYGLTAEDEDLLEDTVDDGRRTVVHRYSGSSEVWLYEIKGGRHDWPLAGTDDFSAAEEIWSFFLRHRD